MKDDSAVSSEEPIRLVWQAVSSDNPVERVARALCQHDGLEADAIIEPGAAEPVLTSEGVDFIKAAGEPAWHKYASEASRFVVAFQAFNHR